MYVCGRCVFVLNARLMPVKTQQSVQILKLTTCQFSKFTHDFTAVHQTRSHPHKDKLKRYSIRYFSDQETGLSSRQTTESILEEERDKNCLVASRTFNVLQIPSTAADPADHISIDLDAVSSPSPFEEVSEDDAIQIPVPSDLPPTTFTLRDYVDKSETLTKLVNLGVNLSKLEERPNVGSMLVRLDFQKDVAPRILFLKDLGIEDSQLGPVLTKNPFLLTESIEHLQDRVSYLKSKKFSSQSVAVMVTKAPYLLNFSVQRLDNRMGFFQQQLGLSAEKTRNLLTRLPRLLCGSLEPVKENLKVCELELGFHRNEIQHIVTVVPKVLTTNKRKLTQIFDFIHNTMSVPHSLIAKFPQVLNAKLLRIRERHRFLEYLGRANYEPTDPNYISLECLVTLPDEVFCTEVALASLDDFERFQKTL